MKGTKFETGQFLSTIGDSVISLLEIEEFIRYQNHLHAICRNWKVGRFEDHLLAYEAEERTDLYSVIDLQRNDELPFSIHEANNKYFFRYC